MSTPPVTGLVRPPGPRLDEGLVTHVERRAVDVDRATEQWQAYVAALADHGWRIVEVPRADDCPDAVFVEDTAVVFDDLAVRARPGAAERVPEVAATASLLTDLGLDLVDLPEEAFLDGGDVLKVGRTVWVGITGRTNEEAVDGLRQLLAPRGWEVNGVPTTRVLHLKSAVTALPDGTVIGHEPLVDDPSRFPSFEPVPEEAGSHVVVLDDHTVLMASSAPTTAAAFRDRGLHVVEVDISEFEKLEGCVTCLSIRVRAAGESTAR